MENENKSLGSITLRIQNLRTRKGQILVAVFDPTQAEFFPKEFEKAFKQQWLKEIPEGDVVIVVNDVPFNDYGIFVLHDMHSTGKIDLNFIGIPKDGLGSSNNPNQRPNFETARFTLDKEALEMDINMKYIPLVSYSE